MSTLLEVYETVQTALPCHTSFFALARVSWQFHRLITHLALQYPPQGSFDRAMWEAFGAKPSRQPPMPAIPLQLYEKCASGAFLCTFIPKYISAKKPLQLVSLNAFICQDLQASHFESIPPDMQENVLKSHWSFLACSVLPSSRGKDPLEQKTLLETRGCAIPRLIDAVVSLLMHRLIRKTNIYNRPAPGIPGTYILVQAADNSMHSVGYTNENKLCFCSPSNKLDYGAACAL